MTDIHEEMLADMKPPPEVVRILGGDAGRIVCLNPLGADLVPPSVQQQGPFMCLAMRNDALPQRLGLDWSYDGAVGIARVLRAEAPGRSATEIFVESVKRWGSLISYDPIGREHLRVCVTGLLPHDPNSWPMLLKVTTPDLLLQF